MRCLAPDSMPRQRAISFCLPPTLAKHVDREARRHGLSRASYVRFLVATDLERYQSGRPLRLAAIPDEDGAQRGMSFRFDQPLAEHVRDQAGRYGVSQAGFLRLLLARDLDQARRQQVEVG